MSEVLAEGVVAALYRYPVKSMQGEQVTELSLSTRGAAGDRALALLDRASGLVASAHHPGKWGKLLQCSARHGRDGAVEEILVTLPDGEELAAGPELERRLVVLLGREVSLIRAAPADGRYEIVHPDVPDTAPESFVAQTLAAAAGPGRVGQLGLTLAAEPGGLVDVAPVHVLTTASLRELEEAGADPDVRRFRPNIVLETGGRGYVEAAWHRGTARIDSVRLQLTIPTPRCIVPTLAQRGVSADKQPLRTLARENRIAIGAGSWACLGSYANVTAPGTVRVGDRFTVTGPSPSPPARGHSRRARCGG